MNYITDCVSYDVLEMSEYSDKFSYVPVYKRKIENKDVNRDSEFTRLALDFPYHNNISLLKNKK